VDNQLNIETDWEPLESGSPEERATYAAIGIRCGDLWLTEAEDSFVNQVRKKIHVSAYPLAEWFAWNWWRLRWEPRRYTHDWAMAHHMSAIGGGYLWPDITIVSDGERLVFIPKPTRSRPQEPLRYLCQIPVVVGSSLFERAVDEFVRRVLERLGEEAISESNLGAVWADVLEERNSSEIARRRKLEALLGYEVDKASEELIERLVGDSTQLGESGVEELAAARTKDVQPATSAEIVAMSQECGFDAKPNEAVRLRPAVSRSLPPGVPAWKRGVAAANILREQERLAGGKISNQRLCQLAGVANAAISEDSRSGLLSFAFDQGPASGRIVMRSKYESGRRFDLARLLGDRIAADAVGALRPATRTYTYRQKLQRAFAGEFLCPFERLSEVLDGDFSEEAIEDAASDFGVSEWVVRTLLVNHGLIERENLDFDLSLQRAA
jgi:hypothetical protein